MEQGKLEHAAAATAFYKLWTALTLNRPESQWFCGSCRTYLFDSEGNLHDRDCSLCRPLRSVVKSLLKDERT